MKWLVQWGFYKTKYAQMIYSIIALTIVEVFAYWWFFPSHIPHNFAGSSKIFDVILFLLVSYIIWHPIIMEVITWFISTHIKQLPPQPPASGLKVAFITTI